MANQNIDTTSGIYQQRLSQLNQVKSFYADLLAEFIDEPQDRQKIWVENDPLMAELVDIARQFHQVDVGVLGL